MWILALRIPFFHVEYHILIKSWYAIHILLGTDCFMVFCSLPMTSRGKSNKLTHCCDDVYWSQRLHCLLFCFVLFKVRYRFQRKGEPALKIPSYHLCFGQCRHFIHLMLHTWLQEKYVMRWCYCYFGIINWWCHGN